MTSYPRIYVACLASYNSGILHGEWIDLDSTEDLPERIDEILKTSPINEAEEWAVHDHEFCSSLSEYPGLEVLQNIIDAYEQTQKAGIDWEIFVGFCDHLDHELNPDHLSDFQEAFLGSAKTLVDWSSEYLDSTGALDGLPDSLRYYFNMEAYACDLEINDVFTLEQADHVLVFHR